MSSSFPMPNASPPPKKGMPAFLKAPLLLLMALLIQMPLVWAFASSHQSSPEDRVEGECKPSSKHLDSCVPSQRPDPKTCTKSDKSCPPKPREPISLVFEPPEEPTQIVETDVRNDDVKIDEVKRLAEMDSRTEKETKAKARAEAASPSLEEAPEPTPKPKESKPTKAPESKPPKTSPSPDQAAKEAELEPPQEETNDGPPSANDAPSDFEKESKDPGLLRPSRSRSDAIKNLMNLAESAASNDFLPEVEDGPSTVLNADSYRFAGFFNDVKRRVERQWGPADLYRKHDPKGDKFGQKSRYTVLKVSLFPDGSMKDISLLQSSGLDFMDSEAKRAMRAAAPFPNPPKGLVKNKEITFSFGFYFEIQSGGRYNLDWRRF